MHVRIGRSITTRQLLRAIMVLLLRVLALLLVLLLLLLLNRGNPEVVEVAVEVVE